MQDREVELGQCLVFPQGPVAGHRQAHVPGDHRQLVVATSVAEVARPDLRAHVPAVEWRGGETDAAALLAPAAELQPGIPPQPQGGEPAKLPTAEGSLEYPARAHTVPPPRTPR